MDEDDAESRRSGERYESEKDDEVGGVWIVGKVEELEDEEMVCECREHREVEEGSGRQHWAQIREDQCDGFSGNGADRCDRFSKIRADHRDGCGHNHDGFSRGDADRRDGCGETRADRRDGFGFYPRRKTCKCQEKADEMKSASWNNPFFALTAIESEDNEEVNAVEAVQEIVEITVDSGAAKSVWPSRKKVVERTKSTRTVKLAAENGSPIRVEGDARLEFVRDGKKCSMRFLDADVKRLLASVSAIVDDGNVVVFGQHELFIESVSTGQRIPMCRRNGVIVMRLGAQPCSKAAGYVGIGERNTNERMPVFRRPA